MVIVDGGHATVFGEDDNFLYDVPVKEREGGSYTVALKDLNIVLMGHR